MNPAPALGPPADHTVRYGEDGVVIGFMLMSVRPLSPGDLVSERYADRGRLQSGLASSLRTLFERLHAVARQAGERQLDNPGLGLPTALAASALRLRVIRLRRRR